MSFTELAQSCWTFNPPVTLLTSNRMEPATLLADLRRTGVKRPLGDFIGEKVIAPMLTTKWVESMRPEHRDEYRSQLYADLDALLDRLRDNDAPAGKVLVIAKSEFAHTRKHMYKFQKKGYRGKSKVDPTHPGPKSPRSRDDETTRPTPIFDDPTIRDMHPCREPSTHVKSRSDVAGNDWAKLHAELEQLSPYCNSDRERELWLKMWLWVDQYEQSQFRHCDAEQLISNLQQRRNLHLGVKQS
jgi:hypothetical protein